MDSAAFTYSLLICVCFMSSTYSGTIKTHKRSTEENNNPMPQESGLDINVNDRFNTQFDPRHFGLQHILPIWWNYFRPLVEITLRDDLFRRELQNQFQQEDRKAASASNEDALDETSEVMSNRHTSIPVTQMIENTAWPADTSESGDIPVSSQESDDLNAVQEHTSMNEVFHFGNPVQNVIDQSATENDDAISPETSHAGLTNVDFSRESSHLELSNVDTRGTEEAVQISTDDALNHRVGDTIANTENDDMQVNRIFTEFDIHSSLPAMSGVFSEFAESPALFQQSQGDEVDVAQPVETNQNTEDSGSDSLSSGRDFDSSSFGFNSAFDDRGMPFRSHNGIIFNNEDSRWMVEQSEQAANINDGRFTTNDWMSNRGEDRMADTDNNPSFMRSGPFFEFMSPHQDSSS